MSEHIGPLKLSLYDQFGYLAVGGVTLLLVVLNVSLFGMSEAIPPFDGVRLIIWLLVAYFVGHLVQALANVIVREKKEDFSDQDQSILEKAREYFAAKDATNGELYQLCYLFSLSKDSTGHVLAFNTGYGLYRGWYTAFLLQVIALIALLVLRGVTPDRVLLAVGAMLIAILIKRRATRFFGYARQKTLQAFMIAIRS